MQRLTLRGFRLRPAATAPLVVASYDPSGYSYRHRFAAVLPKVEPLQAVAGLALLGAVGLPLATARCLALVRLIVSWGWIRLADALLAVPLAIVVSSSLLERRVTGQVVVDEGEHV
jgi:hypothetical protein